jgi:hypothetical protein
MTPQISPQAQALAMRLAHEQGDTDFELSDWLSNRTYSLELLEAAARGDVQALAAVRAEAGLPVFS